MIETDDRAYPAKAIFSVGQRTNADIRDRELERARHALAYLKRQLGNEALRNLLKDDIDEMTAQVHRWVQASGGAWQTDSVELVVPGPTAARFHNWYTQALARGREAELRSGHPEHFVSHPGLDGTIEVIENIGETALPWRVIYQPLPNEGDFPAPWEPEYPVRFGAELLDGQGLRIGFTMHQSRDAEDGMHLKLTTYLPVAAPSEMVQRHLHHFTIEFRNWTRAAWLETQANEK